MRKIFLILAILVAFAVGSACSRKVTQITPTKPTIQQKTELSQDVPVLKPRWTVSIVDHWLVRRPSGQVKDLVAITFVVKNTAPKDVKVRVICNFADDGSLFGESIPQRIGANSDAKLMVRGFRRCPDELSRESFDCRVEPVS